MDFLLRGFHLFLLQFHFLIIVKQLSFHPIGGIMLVLG
jgi:hypothetical protein